MCDFCEQGCFRPAEGYSESGFSPISTVLGRLFSQGMAHTKNGIRLNGASLEFDNSEGEYSRGKVTIDYCPFCGKGLK